MEHYKLLALVQYALIHVHISIYRAHRDDHSNTGGKQNRLNLLPFVCVCVENLPLLLSTLALEGSMQ